jgi:DNA-binding MarR family transcriptional regulator
MEPRATYLVGRLDRVLRRALGEALAPHDLTLAEYTALSVLRTRDGLSNAQLARRALITPQSMNEVLARLVERGYVARADDPAHGRIIRASLTAEGKRALTASTRAVGAVEARMLSGLSAADRERVTSLLAKCVDALAE